MKYYCAIRKNEVLMWATTQMDLGNIMLRERSQTYKSTYSMSPIILSSRLQILMKDFHDNLILHISDAWRKFFPFQKGTCMKHKMAKKWKEN